MNKEARKIQTLVLLTTFHVFHLNSELHWIRSPLPSPVKVTEDHACQGAFLSTQRRRPSPSHSLPIPASCSPCHVPGCSGCSSAVAEGREAVPETGAAGGVCGSTPGQHAAHCGGYVWGFGAEGVSALGHSRQHVPCLIEG